jgi:hypothetical protein
LLLEQADPDAPLLPPLPPTHRLYPEAAWTFHHGDDLNEKLRRGKYFSLKQTWPSPRGRPRTRRRRGLFIWLLKQAGMPTESIARRWSVTPGDVDDVNRETAASRAKRAELGGRDRLVPLPAGPDARQKPYDPCTWLGRLYALGADATEPATDWKLADEVAREHGHGSLGDLLSATGSTQPEPQTTAAERG